VARAAFAPVLPLANPVAVTISGSGDHLLVRAADDAGMSTATGTDALSALSERGVAIDAAEPRTLVVADREALRRLLEMATITEPTSPAAGAAAVVGWWAMRADHPGTGAVVVVTEACAARWVTGLPPSTERQVDVWRTCLGVMQRGPVGLLQLTALVAAGTPLPGLEASGEDDADAWEGFAARVNEGSAWDWRRRDSRREAALGLAARCDATELWESLRLGDPLVATRESFGGTVVSGAVASIPSRTEISIKLDQLTCRLREGTAVEGFSGEPGDLPPAGATSALVRGQVVTTRVLPDECLLMRIGSAILRAPDIRAGQRITLRPRSVDPRQQRSGRHELHRRYAVRRSWLSGGPPPTVRRRDVPLDVVVAAAE
jgi:hypothetical protein